MFLSIIRSVRSQNVPQGTTCQVQFIRRSMFLPFSFIFYNPSTAKYLFVLYNIIIVNWLEPYMYLFQRVTEYLESNLEECSWQHFTVPPKKTSDLDKILWFFILSFIFCALSKIFHLQVYSLCFATECLAQSSFNCAKKSSVNKSTSTRRKPNTNCPDTHYLALTTVLNICVGIK